jgi:aminoglycoside phosphotransferase (APT) family kinase protein
VVDVEVDLRQLRERLAPIEVDGLRPLRGGASSLTYSGSVAGGDARRVVVKVAPAGVPPVRNRDVLRQARLLQALAATAVPVPEVLWEDAGDPPDVPPLFVMSFVDGTSLEPLFDRDGDEDEVLVAERMRHAARTMAALHALDPEELGLAGEPRVGPADEIDRWCRLLETVEPAFAPGWGEVAAALRRSEPRARPDALLHGDLRLGNMLAVGPRIAALIDWEIWSVGDPRVDVGWFLANADPSTYRRATRYVGSLPTRADLAATYVDALGLDAPDLGWFQALACFKSAATWSAIAKHNRRRAAPDRDIEEIVPALPHLLERAEELLAGAC